MPDSTAARQWQSCAPAKEVALKPWCADNKEQPAQCEKTHACRQGPMFRHTRTKQSYIYIIRAHMHWLGTQEALKNSKKKKHVVISQAY